MRIVKPAGAFVTKRSVRVVVHAPRNPKFFRVRADRRDVTKAFRRVRPGVYVGRVRLRAGRGVRDISAKATTGDPRPGFDLKRVILARRRSGYVALRAPRRTSGRLRARIRIGRAPSAVVVRLNGHNVTRAFRRHHKLRRSAVLTAGDGLRFGRNVLVVKAVQRAGRYARRSVVVRVLRRRPLAAAGRDIRRQARVSIRLSGRRSRPASRHHRLRYRWRIVNRPRGSRARLRGARRARPRLRPDKPGYYSIRLTVREVTRGGRPRGASTRDAVQIVATAPSVPVGIPIEADSTSTGNGAAQVTYRGQTYSASNGQVLMTIVDPVTGLVQSSTPYSPGAPGSLGALADLNIVAGNTPNPIVAVVASGPVDQGWEKVVQRLTGLGTNDLFQKGYPDGIGWTALGNPSSSEGVINNAINNASGNSSVSGYVQEQPASGTFAFVSGDYLSYQTRAQGTSQFVNVIQLPTPDGDTFSSDDVRDGCSGSPPAAAGFHFIAFDALSLTKLSERTIATNCNGSVNSAGVQQLITSLQNAAQATSGPGGGVGMELVFLQSVGNPTSGSGCCVPIPAGSLSAVTAEALGDALAGVGGDPSSFLEPLAPADGGLPFSGAAPPPDYAMVGGAYMLADSTAGSFGAAAEANSGIKGGQPPSGTDAGRAVWGTLRRGERWQYEPATARTVDSKFPDLNAVAYQEPTPWPFTGTTGTKDEQAAFQYISNFVLQPYGGTYPGGSCTQAGQAIDPDNPDIRELYCSSVDITTKLDQAGTAPSGIDAGTYKDVWDELGDEVTWRANMRSALSQLASAYDNDLGDVTTNVRQTVSSDLSTAGRWVGVASDVLNLTSAIFYLIPEAKLAQAAAVAGWVNLTSAIGYVAADGLNVASHYEGDLPSQAKQRGQAMAKTINLLPRIYATDYGKLKSLAGVGYDDPDTVSSSVQLTFGRWAAGKLVPPVATARWVNGFDLGQATTPFSCKASGEIFGKDSFFKDQDPRAQFAVGRRMYLLRDGNDQLFPNDSSDVAVGVEPGPVRDQLLDYLLGEFERDPTTDDVVAFGFTKQNFFLRMARQPFDCEQS